MGKRYIAEDGSPIEPPMHPTFGFGFLGGTVWDPVSQVFGAAPFIYGMLVTSALALVLGVPISLGIAIFLSELAPGWLRTPLTYVVELLAAVPSVVYGLWGIFVLAPVMRVYIEPSVQAILGFLPLFRGNPIGSDVFTAGVILAVMIIPTISSVSREALLAVPDTQREAALSLGATRWETTRGDPVGDHASRGPPIRPRRNLWRRRPGIGAGGRRDDGRHDDDREPERDLHLVVRSRTNDLQLDCE